MSWGWGWGSVVGFLPCIHKALSLIPNTTERFKKKKSPQTMPFRPGKWFVPPPGFGPERRVCCGLTLDRCWTQGCVLVTPQCVCTQCPSLFHFKCAHYFLKQNGRFDNVLLCFLWNSIFSSCLYKNKILNMGILLCTLIKNKKPYL